jgi:hypothetical protein
MKNAYNGIALCYNRLALSQVWLRFCGLFKKKSCGASLCKSEYSWRFGAKIVDKNTVFFWTHKHTGEVRVMD